MPCRRLRARAGGRAARHRAGAAPPSTTATAGAPSQRLQHGLHIGADGVFGRGTVRAVKRFQRRHGLHADGVVGAATGAMIRRSAAPRPSRRARASAPRVTGARQLGAPAPARASASPPTACSAPARRAPSSASSAAHGLTADGVVGPATWSALGLGGGHPVLKRARLHGGAARGGGLPAAVRRAISAAQPDRRRCPYRYGGGHRSFSDSGYDCSGSVSYVLHGAGLLGSPLDSSQLCPTARPGRGRWITIYANPGHAYMVIRGRRFDTTGRARDRLALAAASSARRAGYVVRHPPGL